MNFKLIFFGTIILSLIVPISQIPAYGQGFTMTSGPLDCRKDIKGFVFESAQYIENEPIEQVGCIYDKGIVSVTYGLVGTDAKCENLEAQIDAQINAPENDGFYSHVSKTHWAFTLYTPVGLTAVAENLVWQVENKNLALDCSDYKKIEQVIEEPEEEEVSYPIIFLPGVAGSMLSTTDAIKDGNVWPYNTGYNGAPMMFQTTKGLPLTKLIPTDIIRGNWAIGDIYGSFINYLKTQVYDHDDNNKPILYVEGESLFTFPYDWRLSLASTTIDLGILVNDVLQTTGSEKVILIGHSMGGLTARNYVTGIGNDKVDTLITIGSPFKGAGKPFYALTNGYNFDNKQFDSDEMKPVSQNTPAVYHLLPQYRFVYEEIDGTKDYKENNWVYENVIYVANNGSDDVNGIDTVPEYDSDWWRPNMLMVKQAAQFYSKMGNVDSTAPLKGVKHYAIIGTGLPTISHYKIVTSDVINDGRTLFDLPLNRSVYLIPDAVNGDSTVPMDSSDINGVTKKYYIKDGTGGTSSHGDLTQNTEVQKIVSKIIKDKSNELEDSKYKYSTSMKNPTQKLIDDFSIPKALSKDLKNTVETTSRSSDDSSSGVGEQIGDTFGGITDQFGGIGDKVGDLGNKVGGIGEQIGDISELADDIPIDDIQEKANQVIDQLPSSGGGCLIATATYGSELAPQVQQLRELRDNILLNTESGTSFMNTFNDVYYSFSPIIADYERENPIFKEIVKLAITPMISSLSILNYVDIDSESSVLGYGTSMIILNLGMYIGIPVVAIVGIRKKF